MPGVLKSRNMNRRNFLKAAVTIFALTTGFARTEFKYPQKIIDPYLDRLAHAIAESHGLTVGQLARDYTAHEWSMIRAFYSEYLIG